MSDNARVAEIVEHAPEWLRCELMSGSKEKRRVAEEVLATMIANALAKDQS